MQASKIEFSLIISSFETQFCRKLKKKKLNNQIKLQMLPKKDTKRKRRQNNKGGR